MIIFEKPGVDYICTRFFIAEVVFKRISVSFDFAQDKLTTEADSSKKPNQ